VPGTLEYEVWRSIHALEDALTDERGRTTRLSRTRQKIGRQDEAQCVADLVTGQPSDGFRMLAERDMLHLSFEAISLRFPDRFEEAVLDAARHRLAATGNSSPIRATVTSAEGGGFVAFDHETGTTAQGETREAALANLREAVELYREEFFPRTGD
jgi:hypothetical protein